jgi:putative transposase
MNRGAGRRVVFRTDSERLRFISLLAEFDARFDVEVHCFCLMGNHFHLLVKSRSGNLSPAMSWLGGQFTRTVNAERGVDGAIFRGRFHSVLIEREAHLDWLFRYINANPIELGWTQPLAAYPWSGLSTTLGYDVDRGWLRTDYARCRFGANPRGLERFVEAARSDDVVCIAGGVTDDDIAAAVRTACGPGPNVSSDADVRAAHTVVGRRAGLDLRELSTTAHLAPHEAAVYLKRVGHRSAQPGALSELVTRTVSILNYERARSSGVIGCLTPDDHSIECHPVSDTK